MTSPDPRVFNTGHVLTTAQHQEFIVSRPKSTHFDRIGCKEDNYKFYAEGWRTIVPTGGEQDDYIRRKSDRKFVVESVADGLTTFKFGAEQQCFRQHFMPRDKREHFGHRPRPGAHVYVHGRPEDWIEHHNIETDKLRRLIERG